MWGDEQLMRTRRSTEIGMNCGGGWCRLEVASEAASTGSLVSRGIRLSDSDGRLRGAVL